MKNDKAAGMTRREQYEQQQRRKSLIIAAISTIFVIVAVIIFVPMTPGWEKVQKVFLTQQCWLKLFQNY